MPAYQSIYINYNTSLMRKLANWKAELAADKMETNKLKNTYLKSIYKWEQLNNVNTDTGTIKYINDLQVSAF